MIYFGRRISVLIVFSCFIFSSCNKDDNEGSPPIILHPEEKIIGTWQYFKYVESGFSWELDECEKKITYQFFENGTIAAELYLKNEIGECLYHPASGQWFYLISEDKFEIGLDGTGTSTVEIEFSENNTVLTIINRSQEHFIDSYSFIKI